MKITIRYGVTKLENVEMEADSDVSAVILRFGTALGLPESVDVYVNGEVEDSNTPLYDGDTVVFEKAACRKA